MLGPGRAEVSCSAEFQELGSIRFYSELAALAGPSPARQQQARSSLASLDGFLGTDKTTLTSGSGSGLAEPATVLSTVPFERLFLGIEIYRECQNVYLM